MRDLRHVEQVVMAKPSTPSFYDEIVAEVGGGDPPKKCRHGLYLYCDECRTDTHMLAAAIGRHDGASWAALALKDAVGKLFADGKDEEARALREHMRALERQAQEYGEKANELREQQGIIKRGKR